VTDAVFTTVLAGIAYDPEIRGVLIIAFSLVFFCGSGWLLLGTNVGSRLGFLVAAAGLFGWLTVLSISWWIYGVGAIGDLPEWSVEEVNVGDLSQAQLEEARTLLPDNLPDPAQILADNPEIAAEFEEGETPTLSEIAAVADLPPEVSEQLENLEGDWAVLPQTAIGDAQSAADAALINEETGLFTATSEYVLVGGFEAGGKPDPESDSIIDRVTNRVTNTAQVLNPPHYVVIQVQTSEATFVPEGNAPLSPTPDPDEPVVSVIMVRDLGTRRLPPAVLTFMWGGLFALTCAQLHRRDRLAEELSTANPGG
jgi:hypothetical protein